VIECGFVSCVVQELLIRVEESVDEYLYWDEELTIIESVNAVSFHFSVWHVAYVFTLSLASRKKDFGIHLM